MHGTDPPLGVAVRDRNARSLSADVRAVSIVAEVSAGEWMIVAGGVAALAVLLSATLVLGWILAPGPGGVWVQLAITWTAVVVVSLVLPLQDPRAVLLVVVLAVAPAVVAYFIRSRSGPVLVLPGFMRWRSPLVIVAFGALVLALAALSGRVPGPLSAFDTGLYHLSSINQAREFGTLVGAANLYAPYGYHNSLFTFAGFLTEVTVGDLGYRLANAFVLLLGLLDLFTRLVRRSKAPGTILLTFGLGVMVLLTVPLADEWIISPSPDAAVFVLFLVMSAYLVDALASTSRAELDRNLAVMLVTGAVASSIRPLYLLPLMLSLAVVLMRRRRLAHEPEKLGPVILAGLLATGPILAGLARDVMTSGYLWYPLGLFRLPLPWTAPDPAPERALSLSFNRIGYSTSELDQAGSGYAWVGPWFTQYLPSNAGTLLIWAALASAAIAVTGLAALRIPGRAQLRLLALAVLPSGVTVVVWFAATPPALRFAWGPLFALPLVAVAWSSSRLLERSVRPVVPVLVTTSLVLVAGVCISAFVLDSREETRPLVPARLMGLAGQVEALPEVTLIPLPLPSGVSISAPDGPTFQCWGEVLCSPQRPPGLDSRSSDAAEGFVTR